MSILTVNNYLFGKYSSGKSRLVESLENAFKVVIDTSLIEQEECGVGFFTRQYLDLVIRQMHAKDYMKVDA